MSEYFACLHQGNKFGKPGFAQGSPILTKCLRCRVQKSQPQSPLANGVLATWGPHSPSHAAMASPNSFSKNADVLKSIPRSL